MHTNLQNNVKKNQVKSKEKSFFIGFSDGKRYFNTTGIPLLKSVNSHTAQGLIGIYGT